ncbi:MAG: hypothetical protein K6F01_06650 [Selenomonas sp.]|uniref:hypothetical protein n=1 Tax=Selenomonas sp. TaxID=2053611 RepID=UPI0025E1AE09|nr:hypothetical protein [Selenomonas sp.]MCR5439099.1 hypothetical protein [Selenomonas sp.]
MFVVISNLILLSKLDTTDLLTTDNNMNFSVSNSFSDFTTRVVNDYEANIDNNVRHAQETTMFGAMPFSIAAGELVGGQLHMGKEGTAVGVAAGIATAMGYGHFAGRIGGTITTAFEAVEDVVTGHDVNAKDGDR